MPTIFFSLLTIHAPTCNIIVDNRPFTAKQRYLYVILLKLWTLQLQKFRCAVLLSGVEGCCRYRLWAVSTQWPPVVQMFMLCAHCTAWGREAITTTIKLHIVICHLSHAPSSCWGVIHKGRPAVVRKNMTKIDPPPLCPHQAMPPHPFADVCRLLMMPILYSKPMSHLGGRACRTRSEVVITVYCKTLYFSCILIWRFWSVEISLHFHLAFSQLYFARSSSMWL